MAKNKNSGFTIIEIIIVITIMLVLATVAVVSLRTSRYAALDNEKRDDVAAIARHFENIYENGLQSGSTSHDPTEMGYPSLELINSPSSPNSIVILSGIEESGLKNPNDPSASAPLFSLAAATSPDQDANSWASNQNQYYYQPLTINNTLCNTSNGASGVIQPRATSPCVKFNIHYYSQQDSTYKTVKSVNQ